MAIAKNSLDISLRTVLLAGLLLILSNPKILAHTDVTVQQARDLIDSNSDLIVVDVREEYEYCDARGHIPGALNYPWNSGVLGARYEELPIDSPIMVVCRSGGRSNMAANFLDSKGFSMVYDIMGGMNAWIGETTPCKYAGGSGTSKDPYQIATVDDLLLLGDSPEDYDKQFILVADIDMESSQRRRKVFDRAVIAPDTNDVEAGFQGTPFTGVFDGNGYVISNLKIEGESYLGLFGLIASEAEIRNLGIVDVDVTGSGSCIGGFVGSNYASIATSYSTGIVIGDREVGGLAGNNGDLSGSGFLTNCYCSGIVSGKYWVGGLVGSNSFDCSIAMSYSTGTVVGEDTRIGGLVGVNMGSVTSCYSNSLVNGEDYVGGLVGDNGGEISDCYSTAPVNGILFVGGLVGINSSDLSESSFINYAGYISNCYSVGSVSGLSSVGGFIGYNDSNVTDCFWDAEISGVDDNNQGGIPLSTTEMQTVSTFLEAGWDFVDETENGTEDIWWIDEGNDYPRLWWQYGLAFCPYPQDDAIDVVRPVILNWLAGGSGLYHDIYFGEDEEVVANATTESPAIYQARQPGNVTSYDPGKLELNTTYYWRIDEVDETDPNSPWKGNVWSFTTANFLVVDDFESYNDIPEEEPGSYRFYLAWIEGFDGPYRQGSLVGSDRYFIEKTIVHGGNQSMPFYYDNAFGKTEATLTLTDLRDWTIEGVKVLSIWFHGDPANDPEQMFVAIASSASQAAVVYHDNPDAVLIDEWTEWRIDLTRFADQGVDLTNVNSITLGFGNRANPVAGGTGLVYFDDIRLYRPTSQEPKP